MSQRPYLSRPLKRTELRLAYDERLVQRRSLSWVWWVLAIIASVLAGAYIGVFHG